MRLEFPQPLKNGEVSTDNAADWTWDMAKQEIDRLRALNADMLAALRLAHRHPERQHEPGEMPDDCTICAAIARATGRG